MKELLLATAEGKGIFDKYFGAAVIFPTFVLMFSGYLKAVLFKGFIE